MRGIEALPPEIWLMICDFISDLDHQLNRLKSYINYMSDDERKSPQLRKSTILSALSLTSKRIRGIVLDKNFQCVVIKGEDTKGHKLQKLLSLAISSSRTRTSMKSSSFQPYVKELWIANANSSPAPGTSSGPTPRYVKTLCALIPQLTNLICLSFRHLVLTGAMIEVFATSLPHLEQLALLGCNAHKSALPIDIELLSRGRRIPLRSLEIDDRHNLMSSLGSFTRFLLTPSLTALILEVNHAPPEWEWPSLPNLRSVIIHYLCWDAPEGLCRLLQVCSAKAPALEVLQIPSLVYRPPESPFKSVIPNLRTIGCRFNDLPLMLSVGSMQEIILYSAYGLLPAGVELDATLETLEKNGSTITRFELDSIIDDPLGGASGSVYDTLDLILSKLGNLLHLSLPIDSRMSIGAVLPVLVKRASLRTLSFGANPRACDVKDPLWQVAQISQLNVLPELSEVSFFKENIQPWRKVDGAWQLYDLLSGSTAFYRFEEREM